MASYRENEGFISCKGQGGTAQLNMIRSNCFVEFEAAQYGLQKKDDRSRLRQCIGARCKVVRTRHSGTGGGGFLLR